MRYLGAGMHVRMAALGWQRRSGCVGVWGGRPRGGWAGRRGADVSAVGEGQRNLYTRGGGDGLWRGGLHEWG